MVWLPSIKVHLILLKAIPFVVVVVVVHLLVVALLFVADHMMHLVVINKCSSYILNGTTTKHNVNCTMSIKVKIRDPLEMLDMTCFRVKIDSKYKKHARANFHCILGAC